LIKGPLGARITITIFTLILIEYTECCGRYKLFTHRGMNSTTVFILLDTGITGLLEFCFPDFKTIVNIYRNYQRSLLEYGGKIKVLKHILQDYLVYFFAQIFENRKFLKSWQ
jgi:hypothetical protein